jgi:N6-L-threonylcarbamoyladenine synthase
LAYCTDNAAMIGVAACQWLEQGGDSAIDLGISARWPLEQAGALLERPALF